MKLDFKKIQEITYASLRFKCESFKANMCIVPLSLDAQRNSESLLKFILKKKKKKKNRSRFKEAVDRINK